MTAGALAGKICLVSGATSGIGAAAALGLARHGARVFIVGRNRARGEATLARIQSETGNPDIELLLADMSEQRQVRALAADIRARTSKLDVLVNNAGAFFLRRTLSADGIEMTFALNHLSYFLLVNELLDLIGPAAPARIINVASSAHYNGRLDFGNLQLTRGYGGMRAYAQSKLCNILHARELASRLAGTGITANALHPGFVHTRIGQNNGILVRILARLIFRFGRTPEQGADTIVYLATDRDAGAYSGKYFVDRKPVPPTAQALDAELAKKLWAVSAQLTNSDLPEF